MSIFTTLRDDRDFKRVLVYAFIGTLCCVSLFGQEERKAWLSVTSFSYSHYDLEMHELHNVNLDITIHCPFPTAELAAVWLYEEEYGVTNDWPVGFAPSNFEMDDESVSFKKIHSNENLDYELDWNAKLYMDIDFGHIGTIRTDTITIFDLIQDEEVKTFLRNYDTDISTGIQSPSAPAPKDTQTYNINGLPVTNKMPKGLYIHKGKKYLIR